MATNTKTINEQYNDVWIQTLYYHTQFKAYNEKSFCKEFLGNLPLETVQKLLKQHYPEAFI